MLIEMMNYPNITYFPFAHEQEFPVQSLEHECLAFDTAPAPDVVLHSDLCAGGGHGGGHGGGQGGGHGGGGPHQHGGGGLQQGYGAEDLVAGPVPTAYGPPASTAYGPPASTAYGPPASGLAVSYGDGQATSSLLDQVAGHPLRQQGQSLASNYVGLQGKLEMKPVIKVTIKRPASLSVRSESDFQIRYTSRYMRPASEAAGQPSG
jgi:hypothetical protein